MPHFVIAVAGLTEVVSAATIVHLWRQGSCLLEKLYWSTILLIPVLGLLFYLFIEVNPEPHGHDPTGGSFG